nr:putative integron gene cassette protein [uncultured bacterium]
MPLPVRYRELILAACLVAAVGKAGAVPTKHPRHIESLRREKSRRILPSRLHKANDKPKAQAARTELADNQPTDTAA